jgi:Zn-dependent membrane protease YugP
MPVLIVIAVAAFLGMVFGPQLWVRHVIAKHGVERPDLPGTGAELARHLLDEAKLATVKVEQTDAGDHYDPISRTVRLRPAHHDERSVSAVAIAAHEVSHAIQHAWNEPAFMRRLQLVSQLHWVDRAAMVMLLSAPLVFIFVKAPAVIALQVVAAIALLAVEVAVHVTTLPVEFDASFGKALPILESRRYLSQGDMPAARSVLKAAAYTYVAAALATLLNVFRWLRILRF